MPAYAVTLGTLQIVSERPIDKETRVAVLRALTKQIQNLNPGADFLGLSIRLIEVG